jgi:hypothetical protein
MGMGYAGSFALTIQDKSVKNTVGTVLFNKYQKAIDKSPLEESIIINDCFDINEHELSDSDVKLVNNAIKAFTAVIKKFYDTTGIHITRCYHNADDDGDRYDDINGMYWELDFSSVYTLTTKAKKFQKTLKNDRISFSHFVTFG